MSRLRLTLRLHETAWVGYMTKAVVAAAAVIGASVWMYS